MAEDFLTPLLTPNLHWQKMVFFLISLSLFVPKDLILNSCTKHHKTVMKLIFFLIREFTIV